MVLKNVIYSFVPIGLSFRPFSQLKENSRMSDKEVDENDDIGINCDEDELSNEPYDNDEKEPYSNDDNDKHSDDDEDEASE